MNTNISAEESTAPVEIFRKDYEPLPMVVTKLNMDFNIADRKTIVTSELTIETNKAYKGDSKDLPLDGEEKLVKLLSLSLNGKDLKEGDDFTLAPGKLVIKNPPAGSVLKTVVEVIPEDNFKLAGLYKTGPMYCTQCEAMGFRRITYYPDRPDNMAIFEKVRLEADKKAYPILLANGNMIDSGDVDGGRHYATWTDPFPKPSYLFCCVAGDLGKIDDTYTTTSGRKVVLQVYSENHNVHKLDYAMESLKRSMKWDEDRYGLEYDLDLYNIVAVDSFNMGAMENKGLNVFNTAYVLAHKDTATDTDFEHVEGVIGHEYFHNWTGNRVTCRDWFQLTLKEGLTVFRDQEFSGDMNSKAVKRIEDVRSLRAGQFAEDAGPMSHPIRPNSYISMDNFYTHTVYNKGAEVIRMYQTLLSVEGFRKGMDLYFERHDGGAVTCDDFLAAMADANGADLSQFSLWYLTNGTPVVTYDTKYENGTLTLSLTQKSNSEKPLHIPISVGLLDKASGEEVVATKVLELKEMTQEFKFDGLKGDVVPSLLRDFSAPIKLVSASGKEDEEALAYLAARDTDGFNKWEASQKLFTSLIFQAKDGEMTEKTYGYVKEAFGRTLTNKESKDYSIIAYALIMPTQNTLAELVDVVDPVAIHKARGAAKKRLARDFATELKERYDELTAAMEGAEFKVDSESIGRRRLRNVCLDYLCSIRETPEEQKVAAELAMAHFKNASGMTDKIGALAPLASMDGEGASARDEALEIFFKDANGDSLVLNKWFTIQAMADLPDVLDRVKKLTEHPDFTLKNPNRCRSLVRAFTGNVAFHHESGAGYAFVREVLEELDKLNPTIASRMAGALITWKKYNEKRGLVMKAELEKLAEMKPMSKDLFEIVSRGLK
mmetsp:Transcript_31622/g.76421  ORF Transcript_31622/g.76421 Transcript_31622/m.76421 type:complete len:885 (+) Transcript_31622:104-2758(+)